MTDIVGAAAGAGVLTGVMASKANTVGALAGAGCILSAFDAAVPTTGRPWPATLPLPTAAGYSLKPAVAVERADMDKGAARSYRRKRRPMAELAVVWQLDSWQQMILEAFHTWTADLGAAWFDCRLHFPAGLTRVTARFKGAPEYRPVATRWTVTATLEVLQRPVITAATLLAALDDDGALAWPEDDLPRPVAESWILKPKPDVARTDDMPGRMQQRRRSYAGLTDVAARWQLTAAQAALFDGFFVHRGRDGAQWFAFPVWEGLGLTAAEARFTGEAEWIPHATGWSVSAPIELRERPVISAADLALLQDIVGSDLLAAINEFHRFMTTSHFWGT